MSFQYTNDNKILYILGTYDQPLNDIDKSTEEIIFLLDYYLMDICEWQCSNDCCLISTV